MQTSRTHVPGGASGGAPYYPTGIDGVWLATWSWLQALSKSEKKEVEEKLKKFKR